MRRLFRHAVGVLFLALLVSGSTAAATIDFEGLSDNLVLTSEFAGLTFTNATVLTAGIGLNEFEFPPHSGSNVIADLTGPLAIDFASPVAFISAFLTYAEPVTLRVFDAALIEVGSVTSAFGNNLASSGEAGSAPNDELSILFASGFRRAVFTGNAAGSSFALDDLTFRTLPNGVPEPSTVALALLGIAALRSSRPRRCV